MTGVTIWNLTREEWHRFRVRDKVPQGRRGDWRVKYFTVDENHPERIRGLAEGRDTGVGDFASLHFRARRRGRLVWRPMMSDTKAEIFEHYEVIDKFAWPGNELRVLINGLGLGVVLNAALQYPHVTHIDVVERSPDVIRLVGPCYDDPRVTIHQGDAFTYQFPPGTQWDVAWHDIWPSINSDNLPQMHRLHRRYQNRCAWQGSWARSVCEALLREERRVAAMTPEQLVDREWRDFERRNGKTATDAVRQWIAERETEIGLDQAEHG